MDYIIEFDYDADEMDELTIRKGDIVNDVKLHEDGWLLGNLRGKGGVFPSNFGRPLKEEKKKNQDNEEETSTDISDDNKPAPEIKEAEPIELRSQKRLPVGAGFGNIFSSGNIQLKSSREGKTMSIIEEVKPDLPIERKPNAKAKVMAKVIHSYKAENADELTLEEGEILTVLDKDHDDEGWWKGQLPNGKVGVFPDNFVEIMKTASTSEDIKPFRPANTASSKAPPPLTAKPNLNKATPPRPPQFTESKLPPAKPTSRLNHLDKEDGISFETPVNHKPLVGPNAGRAKRPGKKLPSAVGMTTNVTAVEDNDESMVIVSKEDAAMCPEFTPSETTIISKQKPKDGLRRESSPSDNFVPKSKSKDFSSSLDKELDKVPNIVIAKPKAKDTFSFDKTPETSGTTAKFNKANTLSAMKSPDVEEPKSGNHLKGYSPLPKKINQDSESSIHSLDDLKAEMKGLGVQFRALEEENRELKAELQELRKSSHDQINKLKVKLNKLTTEFDEEKAKHAVSEVNLTRLRGTVDDLEISMSLK